MLLFCDGYQHYNSPIQKYTNVFQASMLAGANRNGGQCLELQGGGNVSKSLPLRSAVIVGFAALIPSVIGGNIYILNAVPLTGGLVQLCTISIEGDGSITAWAGSQDGGLIGNTASASPPFYMNVGVWYYIEVSISLGGTAPIAVSATLHVNSVELFGGGANSTVDASSLISGQALGNYHQLGGADAGMLFCDYYINDTTAVSGAPAASTFRGDVRVGPYIVPRQDATPIQWTPSTGSPPSYVCVNSVPISTAQNISDFNVGDIDSFYMTTVPSFVGEIQAAQMCVYMAKNNQGTRAVSPTVAGTVQGDAPEWFLSDSPFIWTYDMDVDPSTGDAWTVADINAQTFGLEIAA